MFLETLCSAIKEIKAPFLFDVEHRIALHAMQGKSASSHDDGEVSWFFSCCSGNLGYILELKRMALEDSCLFSEVRTPF